MNRNILFALVGGLAVVSAVLGYQLYQERQKPAGLHIDLGKGGLSVQTK